MALTEARLRPDFVIGSSVGALNAAHFAGAPDTAGVERLAEIWCGLRRADIFPFSPAPLLGVLRMSGSIVDPAPLWQLMYEIETIPEGVTVHLAPALCPLAVSPYDFIASRRLIEWAQDCTQTWIIRGGLIRPARARGLAPHHH